MVDDLKKFTLQSLKKISPNVRLGIFTHKAEVKKELKMIKEGCSQKIFFESTFEIIVIEVLFCVQTNQNCNEVDKIQ